MTRQTYQAVRKGACKAGESGVTRPVPLVTGRERPFVLASGDFIQRQTLNDRLPSTEVVELMKKHVQLDVTSLHSPGNTRHIQRRLISIFPDSRSLSGVN